MGNRKTAAMESTPKQRTRVDLLMEAFENFAIGIAIRTHGKIMKQREPDGVKAHVEQSRDELREALLDFTRPMLRIVDNEPNGKLED